jgi:hypothetical protein
LKATIPKPMILEKEVKELEDLIEHSEKLKTDVSAKGVDWHIDHSLKVLIGVAKSLKRSDPSEYKQKFNLLRSIVFAFQIIPKGKGRAPKAVLNDGDILEEDLYLQLKEAKEQLIELEGISEKSYFKHPYFGLLNLKMSMQFLNIHTRHHIKIIRDIIK